jgi:zinc/manganese transport system permease protein
MTIELEVLMPALLAALIVLATHVPLGQEVLKRGIVFIDLALAQVAVLGVIVAETIGFEAHGLLVQGVAVGAALAGAALLAWLERRFPDQQEPLIGSLFVLAASLALLLLNKNPHGAEHLRDILEGQILWVAPAQLVPAAIVAAVVLALWFGMRARLGRAGFYPLFALSVTLSVQMVGVYLVFASLILPALAVSRLRLPWRLPAGYALGAASYTIGLGLSFIADLPAAPVIVCLLSAGTAAVWWFVPPVRS